MNLKFLLQYTFSLLLVFKQEVPILYLRTVLIDTSSKFRRLIFEAKFAKFHLQSVNGVKVTEFNVKGFEDPKSLIRIEMELANNALSAAHDYRESIKHLKRATAIFYSNRQEKFHPLNDTIPLDPAWVSNIGHTSSLSTLVKLQKLGFSTDTKYKIFYARTANSTYLNLFAEFLSIEKMSEISLTNLELDTDFLFHPMAAIKIGDSFLDHYEAFNFAEFEFRKSIPKPAHIFSKASNFLQNLRSRMESISLKVERPYVIFHIRESPSPKSRAANNNPVVDYLPAMNLLAKNGFLVVRMGDSSMTPLKKLGVSHELIYDYAVSKEKSNEADVLFWANALFSVCTSSGPAWICNDFGIPSLFTNAPHIGNMHGIRGMVIPQLIYSKKPRSILSITSMLESRFAWNNLEEDCEFARIRNSPNDICMGVQTMLEGVLANQDDSYWCRTKKVLLAMPIEKNFQLKLEELQLY